MKKNVAGQVIGAHLISKTDGSDVTTGTTTVYVTGDNGTQASGSGTVAHKGNGFWTYAPTQAETNYDHVAFTFVNTAAVSVTVQVYTDYPQSGDSYPTVNTNLDTTISSRAPAATALSNTTWTDVKAGYLDAAISSRSNLTSSDVSAAVWNAARSSYNSLGTFGEGVASVQGNVTGSVGSVTSGVTVSTNNDKTGYGLADGAITSAKFASGAITSSAIATDAIGSSQFAQAAADKIWNTTIRTITGGTITTNSDKTGYSLSASGIDAIWDATGTLSISFETLLQRAYEIVNNKMTVNETSGAVTLLSIGGGSTIATGLVTSSSGTTTRNELSWA